MDELDAEVTMAIVEAERADRAAAECWERVRQAEQALVLARKPGTPEHRIALFGLMEAREKAFARRNHR